MTEPDLWGELEQQRELLGAADDKDAKNTEFTSEEQRQIAEQLTELKQYVRSTHELSVEQYRALDERLDYLIEAAERMRRFDWRNALLGSLLGLVMRAVIPAEVVRDVLGVIGRGLAGLLGVEVSALPPGDS